MTATKFPQSYFAYPFEQLAQLNSWGPASFLKFVLLIQSLEQARTWAECNLKGIAVELGAESVLIPAFDAQIRGMVACGWGETASSALYHALRDYQPLQKAFLQYYPEANNISEKEAAFSVFENCRAR